MSDFLQVKSVAFTQPQQDGFKKWKNIAAKQKEDRPVKSNKKSKKKISSASEQDITKLEQENNKRQSFDLQIIGENDIDGFIQYCLFKPNIYS